MKKILTIAILFVMLTMAAMTVVNAATSSTLADELYAIGSKYGMTAAEKVKMERYLSDYPLSNADCDRILALAKEADQIMIDNGTTDYKSLPTDVKNQLKALANEAASIAGVELDFTKDGIKVYKDGKLIEDITETTTSGKLAYTGNNNALVVSTIAVIALAATGITVATKKRSAANA